MAKWNERYDKQGTHANNIFFCLLLSFDFQKRREEKQRRFIHFCTAVCRLFVHNFCSGVCQLKTQLNLFNDRKEWNGKTHRISKSTERIGPKLFNYIWFHMFSSRLKTSRRSRFIFISIFVFVCWTGFFHLNVLLFVYCLFGSSTPNLIFRFSLC